MTSLQVRNIQGEVVGSLELDERVWGVRPNVALMHQAVVAQQANRRRGTASTLTRGRVAGGGKKPRRQKGLGMSRQGSTRAPHWRGGGVVFGPHPRDWHQQLPKKMRKLAMISALSSKVTDDAVTLVDGIQAPGGKTKEMLRVLEAVGASRRVLIVLDGADPAVSRATANIQKVQAVTPDRMTLVDVLNADRLVFTTASVQATTERLLKPVRPPRGANLPPAPAGAGAAATESDAATEESA
ncbi:MAG: 50S ribosomal protein L4 [Chloroflexi bacterium]|nr:50S ribosomal protein L4 [Chloroflexota bacterium]